MEIIGTVVLLLLVYLAGVLSSGFAKKNWYRFLDYLEKRNKG